MTHSFPTSPAFTATALRYGPGACIVYGTKELILAAGNNRRVSAEKVAPVACASVIGVAVKFTATAEVCGIKRKRPLSVILIGVPIATSVKDNILDLNGRIISRGILVSLRVARGYGLFGIWLTALSSKPY
jgi:hypothetical protein